MIEKIILDYLSDALNVPVLMEVPSENIPDTFVVLQKTGGGVENKLYSATLALQSYAPSRYSAALLNESVKEAMNGANILDDVSKSKLNSDYDYTDVSTKRYRYQAVYDINHY